MMKKIFSKIIIVVLTFFGIIGITKAETFYEGDFISGEYINKEIDGKTYYMTMQFIKDSKDNIVYCLEPFVSFEDGKVYKEYSGNLDGYNSLTKEQKRRISLIIYYGYGYGKRTNVKWYAVTQYLVWKVVDSEADIYFTKTLNGTKVSKYTTEQNTILEDVNSHDNDPSFLGTKLVNYGDSLKIEGFTNDYEVVSSTYEYKKNSNSLEIDNIMNRGSISFRKISNKYDNNVTIYDSSNSQDVIRPGNVINNVYTIDINVQRGDITLDIRNDDSVYTVESDFSNTCYEISNEEQVIDRVCSNNENLIYKTDYLKYGTYKIKQVSVGVGYVVDSKEYIVTINNEMQHSSLILYNKLLRNNISINKYACKDDICILEENASFIIYDKNFNIVDKLVTDSNGYTSIILGYGEYIVKQDTGIEGYTIVDEYKEKIVDEVSLHNRELYNNYIPVVEDVPVLLDKPVIEEVVDEIPEIPDTKSDFILVEILRNVILIFRDIFAFFE